MSSEKLISEITLQCLMNKETYEKYRNMQVSGKKTINKKDKKFYRKRIYDLTKRLLDPVEDEKSHIYADLKSAFDIYANSCIEYFKMLDKTDIIQEDYKDYLESSDNNANSISNENTISANLLMMRTIKIQEPNSLERMIKRNTVKISEPVILPQQKDVNLKDPILKNKGIRKKKNITDKYDKPNPDNEKKDENK